MSDQTVFDVLCDAIRKGAGSPDVAITRQTVAADVPGWDSLAHTRIILSAEAELGIQVDLLMTHQADTVGELEQLFLASVKKH